MATQRVYVNTQIPVEIDVDSGLSTAQAQAEAVRLVQTMPAIKYAAAVAAGSGEGGAQTYAGGAVPVMSITPEVLNTDETGATVDTLGYDAKQIVALIGVSGDTLSGSVLLEVEIQHSDDDSVWPAVPDAQLSNTVTATTVGTIAEIDAAAEDDVIVKSDYLGTKRYLRVHMSLTGTHTNGFPLAACITLAKGPKVL